MRNIILLRRSYVVALYGGNRHGVSVQCAELDLVGPTLLVHVDDRPDISRVQLFVGEIILENDAIMFANHPSQTHQLDKQ